MRLLSPLSLAGSASLLVVLANVGPFFVAPTEVQMPGTQPLQAFMMGGVVACQGCHGYYNQAVEPVENWQGSMMAQAGRDPLFFAALAVAEGDFPGAGDFCIRCHFPRGWQAGRASATDGSALDPVLDAEGIECAVCHNMVNPDGSEHPGVQSAPYIANDGGTPAQGYHGSGMVVLAGNQTRYGPYSNPTAGHAWAQSLFHRSAKMCGTCHDVSNPVVGDLAPNNGAMTPLPAGKFSGTLGTPVTTKAAFLNQPYTYGIVERTFSENTISALSSLPVANFASLPVDLQRGALKRAHDQALIAGTNGNYEDNTVRTFTCQSCHMEPITGEGAAFGIAPLRNDQPLHDLTGANTWAPDLIRWLDNQTPSRLRIGAGVTASQSAAMDRGILRARASLQRAAALDVTGNTLRVVNLTGHKLITGYPEGRRMWLRTTWRNEQNQVLREDGRYGAMQANVNGTNYTVNTILDPNARVYETKMGLTQDWAYKLLTLGVLPTLPLAFDHQTGAVTMTVGLLAAMPPGSTHESFHFALNNTILSDNRIPPYGFQRAAALTRNALPVPANQFGNPPANGNYDYFDTVPLNPPAGATRATVDLLYQTTSWEYVQFLKLANPGTSAFLATAGDDVFDGWLATGQSTPEVMTQAHWCNLPGTNEDLVLKTKVGNSPLDTTCGKIVRAGDTVQLEVTSPNGTHVAHIGGLFLQIHDASAPPLSGIIPGLHLDHDDGYLVIPGVPAAGWSWSFTMPAGINRDFLRWQALMLTPNPANGFFALSDAHDLWIKG